MKIKTVKYIAMNLIAGAACLSSTFAGPATWVPRSRATTSSVCRPVTIALSGHTTKQPYSSASEIGGTRLFNAGQGVVSVPY